MEKDKKGRELTPAQKDLAAVDRLAEKGTKVVVTIETDSGGTIHVNRNKDKDGNPV
ncbi:hypothetical protein IPM62_01885 [Candidatus Woesebacteria bacterium]|nr:MAG: hypothetical protein IPM62_01885 [Candidatus Woesebacteria bacterium]